MPDNNVLKIPELSLVLLVGVSGSGKSSFARKHFKPTEVISSDYCRGLVSDDENDQTATKEAFEVLHFIASKRLTAGRLTVVDATNVQPDARKALVNLARDHDVLPVAIVLDLPEQLCHERNRGRTNREFGPHVVGNQHRHLKRSLRGLSKEGLRYVYVLTSVEDVDSAIIERQPLWNNLKHETGPFDIIGDVHGCFDELLSLLTQLGYKIAKQERYAVSHPDGRKVIFLGDLVDRGPQTPEVLRIVMDMVETGMAFCVNGNHDDKLKRKLQGHQVKIAHGLADSIEQLDTEPGDFTKRVTKFLDGLISHYVLDNCNLAVSHAGIKAEYIGRSSGRVREFCMYGETTGEVDEFGLPVRYPWARDYRGSTLVVYGHTPVPEAEWINNTINIDTGCVFGGKLTALRYPEREIISVPAARQYSDPIRPLTSPAATQSGDMCLDIEDVTGKRIVATSLHHNVTIREENAIAALEVMGRFAVDPRWLIYLPPTMSPAETSRKPGMLEHPEEAFAYFRSHNADNVICEEKHMGSRAVVVICKDQEAARTRFGIVTDEIGACYTRTGRPFFSEPKLQSQFLDRVSEAVTRAGLWEDCSTNWFCFDCEMMPWSAKAMSLLVHQYAPVGTAATRSLTEATNLLAKAVGRVDGADRFLQRYSDKLNMVQQYREAFGRYCWPIVKLEDYQLAPFHVLAYEDSCNISRDHLWHLKLIERLCDADPQLIRKTAHRLVDLKDEASCEAAINWWISMTSHGAEGMVVKPLNFTVRDEKGLLQPGIKCRGTEYLRIIYGPEYTSPENLERLRSRSLGAKRSLALREYALGCDALLRFVNREPLHRIHEMVFAVLALESEPVDPRL
jgi:protein phosphatase